ncbi:MAG: adenylosuccinate lyase [Actinobacteria bacterium]|nr:adenylosuccinate lyase [Actinomycetota bacterium]
MIERYSTPEMAAVWTDHARMQTWLEVEIAACEAWAELGQVPWEAVKEIRSRAAFDLERVLEIEEVTHHDVIAFLTNVAEHVGEASKYIHYGMTSSDMLDTALALQIKRSGALLLEQARLLGVVCRRRALEHRDTVMIGRSHGVHAEPIVFGLVLGLWAFEVKRGIERLERATAQAAVGKISGAVGTYANVDPQIEQLVMEKLGLGAEPISTQVVQRDRHAEFLAALALIATTIEKIAVQVRHYQRTEVLEAEEYFAPGQKGSSAMPHKRNPIISERLAGQARVIRGNMVAAFENVPLWHERDISHSSVERVILPDSTILLHYMLKKAVWLVDKLLVYPQNMAANLERSFGLIHSQQVLLALIKAGCLREDAYTLVQRSAMRAWQEKRSFQELLQGDQEVTALLSPEEIQRCFDTAAALRNVGVIFERVEALEF